MKTIKLIDMTLRASGSLRDTALTFKEKLEIARALDRLKVDVIELAPIAGGRAEQIANSTIAATVSAALSIVVDVSKGNIQESWESVRSAKHPHLNLLAPVSTVQMEYACHKKAPAMLGLIAEQVKQARACCESVEFSAVDATRAEPEFLYKAIAAAIEAGASCVTLCDTSGIMLPDEYAALVAGVIANVPGIEGAELYVQPSNEMSMAVACAAAAIQEGAVGVRCSAVPAGYPTLETLSHFAQAKSVALDFAINLRATELSRAVDRIGLMLYGVKKETPEMGHLNPGESANVCLDINDDMSKVTGVIRQLGYELSNEDYKKVFDEVQHVMKSKHPLDAREIKAIIATSALQVPPTYSVKYYVINSCNVIKPTANILLDKKGEELQGVGTGDGPIDAAFHTIEQIIGCHYELNDFQIQTVTEGCDAMGSALVKLRSGNRVYSGSGVSTDIIEASIRAYISALNKIVYEEA